MLHLAAYLPLRPIFLRALGDALDVGARYILWLFEFHIPLAVMMYVVCVFCCRVCVPSLFY
jgi:hypothetical protein